MPSNANPNPNGSSNLNGWSKGGSTTTLTSTADGARWVGGASGTGRYLCIKVPIGNVNNGVSRSLTNMVVRRNSGTARLTKVTLDFDRYYDAGGYWLSSGIMSEDTKIANVLFGVGQTVVVPAVCQAFSVDSGMTAWADAPANKRDNYVEIYIYAENSKDFDFTFRNLLLCPSGDLYPQPVLDASDCTFTVSQNANSKTISAAWNKLPDEAVNSLTWDWGDGTAVETGTAVNTAYQTRSHTYTNPGVYTVKLTSSCWSGLTGSTSASTTKTVTVPIGTFEANFAYETDWLDVAVDASSSIAPSLSPIDTYAWDWGDGDSTAANASKLAQHTYAAPGAYNVTLTVHDTATNRTATHTKTVTVFTPPSTELHFATSKDLLKVAFIPSVLDGAAYAWDFGDGNTSSDPSPTHTYASPGTYAVTLTVDALDPITQDVTVTDVYTPLGNLMDALRLEVAIPRTGVRNLLPNPSGEGGAWSWWTTATNSYMTGSTTADKPTDKGITGAKLIYRSSGSGDQYIRSTTVRAVTGQYARALIQVPYIDGYYRIRLECLDTAGTVVAAGAWSGYQLASATTYVTTGTLTLATAGITAIRLQVSFTSNTGTGVPAANKLLIYRRAMLAVADTSGELSSLTYSEGQDWQDLIGPTSDISVTRDALNLGTLSATILDSTFDPATSGTIRPGQTCRLRVKTPDEAGNVRWSNIFTGSVGDPEVEYVPVKGSTPGPKATRIKLTAYDAVQPLTKWKRAEGVAKIKELPEILEGIPVPYEINGSTSQVPSASIVNANDNASVLDQIAITRDSDGGYAFVSRDGVLIAREPEFMPTVPVGVINEAVYSGIEAGFALGDVINSVSIKWLRYTAAAGDEPAKVEEVVYGPYEDNDSIEEWDLRPATFTMLGVENPTAIAARAAEILAANAQPARMITGVTVPIRYLEDLSPDKALLDLYDLVRLGYQRTETDELIRVTGVSHKITPKSWLMSLGFSADGAVATPQLVAAPPVTLTESGLPFGARLGSATGAAPTQQIQHNQITKVTLLTVDKGAQGGVTWSTTNNEFTVTKPGIYLAIPRVAWAGNSTGLRLIYVYINGVQTSQIGDPGKASAHGLTFTEPLLLAAGDKVDMRAYQSSGSPLNLINNAGNCAFSLTYQGT